MSKFRRAKEIPKIEKKMPISCRIRGSLKASLIKEAKGSGHTLSELIEAVLEDYVAFLKEE